MYCRYVDILDNLACGPWHILCPPPRSKPLKSSIINSNSLAKKERYNRFCCRAQKNKIWKRRTLRSLLLISKLKVHQRTPGDHLYYICILFAARLCDSALGSRKSTKRSPASKALRLEAWGFCRGYAFTAIRRSFPCSQFNSFPSLMLLAGEPFVPHR